MSMNAGTWQPLIAGASTVGEVVAVAQEFVSSFDAQKIAALPQALRPARLHDANDVTSYAYELMRHERGSDAAGAAAHLLSDFFSQAAARIAQLSVPSAQRDRLLKLFR